MVRIIQTYSLGVEEVQLLEAYAVRHKMKKSQIIGKLLKEFLVLETCYNCESRKFHLIDQKVNEENHYRARDLQKLIDKLPNPAIFGYHFHQTGAKHFLCTECADVSRDNVGHMVRDNTPYTRVGDKPGHKWEYTLINNLSKKDYNEYVDAQKRKISEL